jgi:hypothetical protein
MKYPDEFIEESFCQYNLFNRDCFKFESFANFLEYHWSIFKIDDNFCYPLNLYFKKDISSNVCSMYGGGEKK